MITITQTKIAGLDPRWAPFRGFSLLFDAPSEAFRIDGPTETLACAPGTEFFARAAEGLASLNPDRLLQTYGFCALPPASYHVTAFDVANEYDLPGCHAEVRDPLRAMLGTMAFDDPLLAMAVSSELANERWDIEFRFRQICHWGKVLTVGLEPVDADGFARFMAARARLSEEYRRTYRVGAKGTFTPHLTLGYFLNAEGAELALARVPAWGERLQETLAGRTLHFPTVSLYGFTDMATFFRQAKN